MTFKCFNFFYFILPMTLNYSDLTASAGFNFSALRVGQMEAMMAVKNTRTVTVM